jgi:cyclophilin family peptidyl-prolyl cis-trans isomerase
MANKGPNTNSSQFFITMQKDLSYLDGKNVVFGRVTEGIEILKKIEKWGSKSGETTKKVTINNCGVYK